MELTVLIAALLVMAASLVGVVFIHATAQKFLEEKLPYLISFSAGVFLVTAGGLVLEVFELTTSLWQGAGLITLGYGLAWAIHALMPESHHHHADSCDHRHGVAARKLIIGDAIHNIADGVLLVVAFSVSPALGIAATVSIFIHEILQELSEFFVLRQAGYSATKALTVNFLVSSTILIGVGLGYFALASPELEVLLLAVSGGFFIHVVLHDLLPKRSEHETSKSFASKLALVIVGVALMGFIASILQDGHLHGQEADHADHFDHGDHHEPVDHF